MHGLYLNAGPSTEGDLAIVQADFAFIYRTVERMEARIAAPHEDQLLSYHCIAFEPWVRLDDEGEGYRKPKQLIQHILQNVSRSDRPEWIKAFSRRLRDTYASAFQMLEARDAGMCDPLGDLTVLQRLAPFWPLLLKCWKYDSNPEHSAFATAVNGMRALSFRSLIAGKRSDTGDADLRNQARDFVGVFSALNTRLSEMATWWSIPESFARNLDAPNFYDFGRVATYLLWKYENYLRSRTGKQSPRLEWATVAAPLKPAVRYAKDHIEPKDQANPTLSRMTKWHPEDKEERPFRDVYLHRLGNLVLDTIAMGAANGNAPFVERVPRYLESALVSQTELVTRFANREQDGAYMWDEAAIRKRHDLLVNFAKTQL